MQNKTIKYYKLLIKTLLKLSTFKVLYHSFYFWAFTIVSSKFQFFDKTFKS